MVFVSGLEELRYIAIIRIGLGEIGDIEMIRDKSLVRVMKTYRTCTRPCPGGDQSCFPSRSATTGFTRKRACKGFSQTSS